MQKQEPRKKATVSSSAPADNSHYTDPSSLIVDVGDPDVADLDIVPDEEFSEEDLDVVDLLGADFDVTANKRKKVRKHTSALIEEIDQEPESTMASDAEGQPPLEQDEMVEPVRTAVRAADDRKAEDVRAIRISKLTYIASFVIIATGNNTPQIRAIGNLIEEELAKKHEMFARRRDGTANSGWMLLDYGDLLVNIFSPEQREKYNLEALWRHGEELDVSDCITGPETRALQSEDEAIPSLDNWID